MQDEHTLTEAEVGKKVLNEDGDELGRVMEVEDGTAHVDPEPGLTDTILSKFGWSDKSSDTYRLESSRVESITDDHVQVNM